MVDTTDTTLDIVDLQYTLSGKAVAADYADALCHGIELILPWMSDEPAAGIHPLSSLSPGEGGWYLSRRSRLTLRLPRQRVADAAALSGSRLDLGKDAIEIGSSILRELEQAPVLYSKFVVFEPAGDGVKAHGEKEFMAACRDYFASLGAHPDLICGKARQAMTASGLLSGFSLLLSGINAEVNLHIQRHGLGIERRRGCGIFIPHKTFAAMATLE